MTSIHCEIDFPVLPTLTPSERLRHVFTDPQAVHVATKIDEVASVLEAVSRASAAGHWCVGFVAHEAAGAFDSALATQVSDGGPLACNANGPHTCQTTRTRLDLYVALPLYS